MVIEIVREGPEVLDRYAEVSIAFQVDRRFVVTWGADGISGISLTEEAEPTPYSYDYDAFEQPTEWRRWDQQQWGFFAAYDAGVRIGGAVVARATPGVYMLEGRPDLACLWDIRVSPERRGEGIGGRLFAAATAWAQASGASMLKIETQNINVNACRFYVKQGCRLEGVHPAVYMDHPEQVQLLWYKRLG